MNSEPQRRFDAVERQRIGLQASVSMLTEAQVNWKPDAETWSVAQIIQHLVLSAETVGRAQDAGKVKNAAPMFRVLPRALRFALVLRAMKRDVTLPLPSPAIEPISDAPLSEWLLRWEAAQTEMRRVLEAIREDEIRYSHPVLGPLTAAQMLELAEVHTAYHTRQLETLRRNKQFPRRVPSPFVFEIEEHHTVKAKGIAVIIGRLLKGKIHVHDLICVPTQQGAMASGAIVDVRTESYPGGKFLIEIEAGQADRVCLFVSRLGAAVDIIITGKARNSDMTEETFSQ